MNATSFDRLRTSGPFIFHSLINFILPPRCPWCRSVGLLPPDQPVCSACLREVQWSPGPWLSNKVPDHCDSIHAVALFQGPVRDAVHALKYQRKPYLAASCAAIMLPVAKGLPTPDLVLAVPLSPKRLRQRRYNQAEWLARRIATALAVPLVSNGVERAHVNTPQVGLGASARWENVHRQFSVPDRNLANIEGKHLLIIDDVVTTGATLQALGQTLKKSGAKTVRALTLAQTV